MSKLRLLTVRVLKKPKKTGGRKGETSILDRWDLELRAREYNFNPAGTRENNFNLKKLSHLLVGKDG